MNRSPRRPDSRTAETDRTIGGLFRVGVVVSVEGKAAVVEFEDGLRTPPIEWVSRFGYFSFWCPPSEGEQVGVIVPDADLEQAVILGSLSSDANPPASDLRRAIFTAADGFHVEYDPDGGRLTITAPAEIEIVVPTIKITSDIELTGKLTATDDVIAAGKSLKGHRHTGVAAGAAVSGPPQ